MLGTRLTVLAALIPMAGCGLVTGISNYSVDDSALPSPNDKESGRDSSAPTGSDASGPQTIAPEGDSGPAGPEAPSAPQRPPAGTYSYTILSGSEELKGGWPFKTTYGQTAKVTIAYDGDNCFNQTISLRDGYDERMHECIVGTDIVHDGGERNQTFPLVGNVSTKMTCAPGDAYFGTVHADGQIWKHLCEGSNADSKTGDSHFFTGGDYAFVGMESLFIGTTNIPVLHYHDARVVTDKQTGTNDVDLFFTVDTGLLVRFIRNTNISYQSIVGKVNYLEAVTMQLTKLP